MVREHYFILILALFLTLLVAAPVLLYPFIAGEAYQGINIAHFGTDAHFYLARMRDAMDGYPSGNSVLAEGKDRDDHFFMLNEQILAAPIRLLGLQRVISAPTVYHGYNFIGVFALILLIYSLVFRISREKLLAALAAIAVVGGYHIVYNKRLFYADFNMYGRAMFPYIASLAFFAYLNLLTVALNAKRRMRAIAAGLAFGALFYVYFFAWTFALALNGALFIFYLFRRDWDRLGVMMLVTATGILLGVYNVVRMALFFTSDAGAQASYFHWASYGRTPIMSKIGTATAALWALFFYKHRRDENGILILGLIAAGWIALNQQIITGRFLQVGHYYWYFVVPISIIIGFYMLWQLIGYRRLKVAVLWFLLLLIFVHSGVGQYRSLAGTVDVKQYEQRYRPIIDALSLDAGPAVVLAADDPRAYLFAIYTPHDLFWHQAATQTDTPLSRFRDAIFIYFYLNRHTRENFSESLHAMAGDVADNSFYKNLYTNIEGFSSGMDYFSYERALYGNDPILKRTREKLVSDLTEEYKKIKDHKNGIVNLLTTYNVKYIVWDKALYPEWDLAFLDKKEEIMSSGAIYLYRLY